MTDTHLTTTPAMARTDTAVAAVQTGPPLERERIRRLGLGLTLGALAWASSIFVFGPTATGIGGRIGDLTGLLFQLGVFCLLSVQMRTLATGTSRAARGMLKVEAVLLGVASVWSLVHGLAPASVQDAPWLMALDAFWPLSMLGMMIIAVKIALAGRWRGLLRWWPLAAESWAIVTVPTVAIFGDAAARVVGGTHLLVGYAALGLLLRSRPDQTS